MPIKTIAFALSVAIFGLLPGSSLAVKQYALKSPKQHCKPHYVKKVETTKRHEYGRVVRVQKTLCVYLTPKAPVVDPPPASIDPALVVSTTSAAPGPIIPTPPSTPVVPKEPIKEEPVKESHEPTSFETTTTLSIGAPECSEEIKERLGPYARVKRCKYDLSSMTMNREGVAPPNKIIWFTFPDGEGFTNFEFEAENRRSYKTTVVLEEELGIRGEVTSESCRVEIESSLYDIRDIENCAHLPMRSFYGGDEVLDGSSWLPSHSDSSLEA